MRSRTPPPAGNTGGSFLERRTANSHHVGRYVAGRKEGLGMVHTFSPSLSLVIGTFTSSLPNGLGSIIVPGSQATRYVGCLKDGKPQGIGIMVSAAGVYRGNFLQGAKQGYGIEIDWNSGEERKGFFTNGRLGGVAVITQTQPQLAGQSKQEESYLGRKSPTKSSPNKSIFPKSAVDSKERHAKFVGHVQEGVPHGSGHEQTADGEQYFGFYSWGRRHGVGKLIRNSANQTKEYLGDWKDGSRTGFGFENSKGSTYFGTFAQGRREGVGECTYFDASEYIGQFMGGQKHGFGKLKTAEGGVYIGNWRHDKQDGIGFYSQNDPSVKYFGVWRGGQFLQDKGVDLSFQNQDSADLELTRANEEDTTFSLNSTFFDEATTKIIEIDQRLTNSKMRIKKEYLSVITDYSKDLTLIEKSSKHIDDQVKGALRDFSYLWTALMRASQNSGYDIQAAAQLLEDLESRGFHPEGWTTDQGPLKYTGQDLSDTNRQAYNAPGQDRFQQAGDPVQPPMNSMQTGTQIVNQDPLRDVFSLEKDGTSVTDSDRNTLTKMGGSLLKSKQGVSPFNYKGPATDAASQMDTPRSNRSQENMDISNFRGRPASRSQITIPALKEEPVRNLTPRAGQSQKISRAPSQKKQYRIDPTALGSSGSGAENKEPNQQNTTPVKSADQLTKGTIVPNAGLAISMMPEEEVLENPRFDKKVEQNATNTAKPSAHTNKENSNPQKLEAAARKVVDVLRLADTSKFKYSDLQNTVSDLKNRLTLETLKCEKLKRKVDATQLQVRSKLAEEILEPDKQTAEALLQKKKEIEQQLEILNTKLKAA